MNSIKFFSFTLVIGSVFAGVPHQHHHHHLGYRGYYSLAHAPAVEAKSAPVFVSKGVPAVAAVLAYSLHDHAHGHAHAHGHTHAHTHGPVAYVSGGVGIPAAYAYAAPSAEHIALLSTAGKPKVYGQSIPAAAVRNVETVMVTKTITPVVTKTTTHHTHAEPALSIGHVQGYSQGAVGHPKIAPVQFNTAYTTYANPTVGINGPVVYNGPAVGIAQTAIAAAPVVPEPVVKTAIASPAAIYKSAPAYAVYPGSSLSLSSYGIDAHSVPITNFIELRSGQPVFQSHGHAHAHAYGHK